MHFVFSLFVHSIKGILVAVRNVNRMIIVEGIGKLVIGRKWRWAVLIIRAQDDERAKRIVERYHW